MANSQPHRRLLVVVLGTALLSACRYEPPGQTVGRTKRLPESEPKAQAKNPAVQRLPPLGEKEFAYSIELQRPDGSKRVREDYPFHSQDGFRLLIKPGFSAYLYLINRGARDSRFHVLFPSKALNLRNPVRPGDTASIPDDAKKWMRMDQTP